MKAIRILHTDALQRGYVTQNHKVNDMMATLLTSAADLEGMILLRLMIDPRYICNIPTYVI